MPRITQADHKAAIADLQKQNALLQVALNLAVTGKPDAREIVRCGEGARYVYRLYGSTRACGGIVLETYERPGQQPSTTARYLDQYPGFLLGLHEHNAVLQSLRRRRDQLAAVQS